MIVTICLKEKDMYTSDHTRNIALKAGAVT